MDPVYIDGEATGKHDDKAKSSFHGILMPCATGITARSQAANINLVLAAYSVPLIGCIQLLK